MLYCLLRSSKLVKKLPLTSTLRRPRSLHRLPPRHALINSPGSLALTGKLWKRNDSPRSAKASASAIYHQKYQQNTNCSTLWKASHMHGSWARLLKPSSSASHRLPHRHLHAIGFGPLIPIVTRVTSPRALGLLRSRTAVRSYSRTHYRSGMRFKKEGALAQGAQSREAGIKKPKLCNRL